MSNLSTVFNGIPAEDIKKTIEDITNINDFMCFDEENNILVLSSYLPNNINIYIKSKTNDDKISDKISDSDDNSDNDSWDTNDDDSYSESSDSEHSDNNKNNIYNYFSDTESDKKTKSNEFIYNNKVLTTHSSDYRDFRAIAEEISTLLNVNSSKITFSNDNYLISEKYYVEIMDEKYNNKNTNQKSEIFVKTLTGKTITLKINLHSFVQDVKYMVEDKEGIPPERIRIITSGKDLEPHRRLSEYNITPEATLHLVGRLRGS